MLTQFQRKPDPTKFERKLLAGSSATEGLTVVIPISLSKSKQLTDLYKPPPLHASILRVNRQLSATGRRYLYTANRFVLVHVDILGPQDLGEKLLTKYVSKTHLDDFKHHVLEFHCKAEVTASFKGLTHWVGSYLLREQDLHLFLIKLQGLTFVLRADQVYLLPAAPSPMPETPVRFKLRAPVVDWSLVIDIPSQRPFDRNGLSILDQTALHESLLREFKSLAGTTCQVIMNGAASQHVESCNHLNARIVSTDAMGVHLMQVLNEWEQSLADLLPSAHKMPYVQHAYRLLLDVATHNSLTTNGPGETAIVPVFGPGSFEAPDTWELAVRVICLDLFLTCINIEMHAWLEDTNSCLLLGDVVLAMRSFAQGFKPPAEDLCARVYHALAVLPGPMNPLTNDSQELMLHSALMWTPDDLLLQADLEVVLRRKRSPVSTPREMHVSTACQVLLHKQHCSSSQS